MAIDGPERPFEKRPESFAESRWSFETFRNTNRQKKLRTAESLRGDVKMMRRNIELETRLIDELIDLNRITKGRISLRLELVDVHALISSVLKMYASEIYSRGLSLATDLTAENPYMNCDRDRLQQVFWNILKNAAGPDWVRSFWSNCHRQKLSRGPQRLRHLPRRYRLHQFSDCAYCWSKTTGVVEGVHFAEQWCQAGLFTCSGGFS